MRANTMIKRAFDYLVQRAQDGIGFTREELAQATGWTQETSNTMLSKKLEELVREDDGILYSRPEILRVRLSEFQDLFRQKQRLFAKYELKITSSVLVYEFFMPLSREDRLRETLDSLFYTDTIEQRIREIGVEQIRNSLDLPTNYSIQQIISYVYNFINDTIGGYSLYLVSGRFRADSLTSRGTVASRPLTVGPYLVDETTAVVRFVLPIETTVVNLKPAKELTQSFLFEPAQVLMRQMSVQTG